MTKIKSTTTPKTKQESVASLKRQANKVLLEKMGKKVATDKPQGKRLMNRHVQPAETPRVTTALGKRKTRNLVSEAKALMKAKDPEALELFREAINKGMKIDSKTAEALIKFGNHLRTKTTHYVYAADAFSLAEELGVKFSKDQKNNVAQIYKIAGNKLIAQEGHEAKETGRALLQRAKELGADVGNIARLPREDPKQTLTAGKILLKESDTNAISMLQATKNQGVKIDSKTVTSLTNFATELLKGANYLDAANAFALAQDSGAKFTKIQKQDAARAFQIGGNKLINSKGPENQRQGLDILKRVEKLGVDLSTVHPEKTKAEGIVIRLLEQRLEILEDDFTSNDLTSIINEAKIFRATSQDNPEVQDLLKDLINLLEQQRTALLSGKKPKIKSIGQRILSKIKKSLPGNAIDRTQTLSGFPATKLDRMREHVKYSAAAQWSYQSYNPEVRIETSEIESNNAIMGDQAPLVPDFKLSQVNGPENHPRLAQNLATTLNEALQGSAVEVLEDGTVVDYSTGLHMTFLEDEHNPGELIVVFGGTSAGASSMEAFGEKILQAQWGTNIAQGLGNIPASDMQAVLAAKSIVKLMGMEREVTFTGHSKGGKEAIAAALATGKRAFVDNPAPIAGGLKQLIKATAEEMGVPEGRDVTNQAQKYVHTVSTTSDPVSHLMGPTRDEFGVHDHITNTNQEGGIHVRSHINVFQSSADWVVGHSLDSKGYTARISKLAKNLTAKNQSELFELAFTEIERGDSIKPAFDALKKLKKPIKGMEQLHDLSIEIKLREFNSSSPENVDRVKKFPNFFTDLIQKNPRLFDFNLETQSVVFEGFLRAQECLASPTRENIDRLAEAANNEGRLSLLLSPAADALEELSKEKGYAGFQYALYKIAHEFSNLNSNEDSRTLESMLKKAIGQNEQKAQNLLNFYRSNSDLRSNTNEFLKVFHQTERAKGLEYFARQEVEALIAGGNTNMEAFSELQALAEGGNKLAQEILEDIQTPQKLDEDIIF